MKTIEIRNVQFTNKGAELMLWAIRQHLERYGHDVELCLQPDKNSQFLQRAKFGAYQRVNLKKNRLDFNWITYFIPPSIRQKMKDKWGMVFEADVDVIMDASGFAYGAQWSEVILHQLRNEVVNFKRRNKTYIFMPQSFGPFVSKKSRKLMAEIIEHCSLIFARDEQSYSALSELSAEQRAKLHLVPDFTCDVEYTAITSETPYFLLIPNSKMQSGKNKDSRWREHYVAIIAELGNILIGQGHRVKILNHSGYEDDAICEKLLQQLTTDVDIILPSNALETKAIISAAQGVVSSRYHGCVSALSAGVPCLATSWSHKYSELYKEYGDEHFILRPFDDDYDPESATKLLLQDSEGNKLRRLRHKQLVQRKLAIMWGYIREQLPGSN